MTKLNSHSSAMTRQAEEGVLIGELDQLEAEGRAVSLNSKKDYMQAHTVTLNFHTGARKET